MATAQGSNSLGPDEVKDLPPSVKDALSIPDVDHPLVWMINKDHLTDNDYNVQYKKLLSNAAQGLFGNARGAIVTLSDPNVSKDAILDGNGQIIPAKLAMYNLTELARVQVQIDEMKKTLHDEEETSVAANADLQKSTERSNKDLIASITEQEQAKSAPPSNSAFQTMAQRRKTGKAQNKEAMLPVFSIVQNNYYRAFGTVVSPQIAGSWGVNLGFNIPFGNQYQIFGQILPNAAKTSPLGWIFVGDTFMQEVNNWKADDYRNGTCRSMTAEIFPKQFWLLSLMSRGYMVPMTSVISGSFTAVRSGIMETLENRLFGHRDRKRKLDLPFIPNSKFHYKYGPAEISFTRMRTGELMGRPLSSLNTPYLKNLKIFSI